MARMKWGMTVALMLLAGCATAPSVDELAHLDYGTPVTADQAKAIITQRLSGELKDPYSAKIDCDQPETGWIKKPPLLGGGLIAGYRVNCTINAKNSYGAYVGERSYMFIIHDGMIVDSAEETPNGLMPSSL